ncbi:hypothetical protein CN204_31780, partial [Sinorhizobium meliloti]
MIAKTLEMKPQSALQIVGEFGLRGGFWGIISLDNGVPRRRKESCLRYPQNWVQQSAKRLCASSSAKLGGHACWSCGLTECEFLVLSQVV